jgi:DNA polymerase III alpha subunit
MEFASLDLFKTDIGIGPKELVFNMGDGDQLLIPSRLDAIANVKNQLEYIGFVLNGSLLDPYETHVRSRSNMVTTHFANDVVDGEQNCHVAGVITQLRKKNDRNGNPYCFLTMSDGRTDIRVLVFNKVFVHFDPKTWKTGKGIVVDGRKDGGTLIASDVTFLRRDTDPNANQKKDVSPKEVYKEAVQETLQAYDPGEDPGF